MIHGLLYAFDNTIDIIKFALLRVKKALVVSLSESAKERAIRELDMLGFEKEANKLRNSPSVM